jgi:hypothetical protein
VEAVFAFDGGDERVDVWQHCATEPCTSHEEVALVVQFLTLGAESDNFGCAVNQVSLNQ